MSIIRKSNGYSPVFRNLLSDFFESENLRFDEMFRKDWVPAVNVSETDKMYEIELAAPGLKRDDFHVKVADGVLTISSERKTEKETKDKNYTRKEFSYSSFSRSFTLPENAKEEEIKATYENGVLKLNVAKTAVSVAKAKEIAVL
ncbi:MAG: Hsp20/alpha crystallin family protein [Bacteroidota bacterium]